MYDSIKKVNLPKPKIILFFTILLTLIVYKDVGSHQFQTAWDDQWAVQNWYTEEGFSGENTTAILLEFYGGQYAPVNQFYYTLLHNLFGYNATAFHMAGLVIHILTVVTVFFF